MPGQVDSYLMRLARFFKGVDVVNTGLDLAFADAAEYFRGISLKLVASDDVVHHRRAK